MGVYLGQSVYNDSQVTQEWVDDEIAKNGKGVFFVDYDQTTFANVLLAYNDGKIIVCRYTPQTPGEETTYYLNLVRFDTETFDFVGVMKDGTIYRTSINVNEGWANVTTFKTDEIEFVEYNVDSYSTIKSYYDNGKFVVLKYRQQTPLVTKYYFYPLISFDQTNDEFIFGSLQLGQNNKKVTFTVTDSTGWAAPVESSAVIVDATLDQTSHNPVENMAIAAELADINNKITGDLNDIFLALASKGVTVPAGAGLDDVAGLIDDIQTGGGSVIPPDQNTFETYLYFEKPNGVDIRVNYRYSGLKVSTEDIIETSIYIQNAIQENTLPGSADIGSDIFMQVFGSQDKPSGGSERKIHFGYGPDRWTNTFEPTQYHLRCFATNWQNGSYYYGPCACVYIGDIASDTILNIKQTKEYLEVNGSRTNYSAGSFADFETDYNQIPDLQSFPDGARIYEINIKDKNGTPKFRFVPCKNKTSDTFGFWECITGAFYALTNNSRPTPGPIMPIY